MRFPIDVLFLKTIGNVECGMWNVEVVSVIQCLQPFRLAWAGKADMVIELPVNTISRTSTALGERIAIEASDASAVSDAAEFYGGSDGKRA